MARRDRPNIIWVFADQMRGAAMSCASALNGPTQNVYTPNLDAMAARGVRFTNACATNPVCVPFRFSLMTGQYTHSRSVLGLHYTMSPAERTIAHEMNDAGYRTSYFGKWHLRGQPMGGNRWGSYVPPKYRGGFTNWHGFESTSHARPLGIYHGDDTERTWYEGFHTDVLFDQLIADLEAAPAEPFFSVLSFLPPHPPYKAPEANLERQRQRRLVHHPNVRAPGDRPWEDPNHLFGFDCEHELENLDEKVRHYYALVENIDDNMGRLYQALERMGRLEDTYVFFFSDHGDMLGSQHMMKKNIFFEESVNIPLIVTGPDVPPGQVLRAPACAEDFYPTTCGLAGVEPANEVPGEDLSAYLRDPDRKPERQSVLLEQVNEVRQTQRTIPRIAWRALRTERYSLIALKHQVFLLYDLEEDPYQQQNLVDDPGYASVLRELAHALERRIVETEDFFEFDAERGIENRHQEPEWGVPPLVPEDAGKAVS